jgi:hypothetical protein
VVELKENDELAKNKGKNGHFFLEKDYWGKKNKEPQEFLCKRVFLWMFFYINKHMQNSVDASI